MSCLEVDAGLLCRLCGLLSNGESPSVKETACPPETCVPTALVSGAVDPWLLACGGGVDLLFLFSVSLGRGRGGGHPGNCSVSALGTWEAAECFSGSRKCCRGLPNFPLPRITGAAEAQPQEDAPPPP